MSLIAPPSRFPPRSSEIASLSQDPSGPVFPHGPYSTMSPCTSLLRVTIPFTSPPPFSPPSTLAPSQVLEVCRACFSSPLGTLSVYYFQNIFPSTWPCTAQAISVQSRLLLLAEYKLVHPIDSIGALPRRPPHTGQMFLDLKTNTHDQSTSLSGAINLSTTVYNLP